MVVVERCLSVDGRRRTFAALLLRRHFGTLAQPSIRLAFHLTGGRTLRHSSVLSPGGLVWSSYSGWKNASVFPSGSLSQADLPMPGVVATWSTVLSVGKS